MSSLVSVTSTSKTARAHPDDSSSVSFAASFLRGETFGHVWSEYVQTLPLDYDPPWAEFSKVLWDDLGNEKTFVDKTWGKFFSFVQRPGDNVRTFCHEMPPTSPRASITCLDLMTTHGRRAMPSGPSYHSSNSPITDH